MADNKSLVTEAFDLVTHGWKAGLSMYMAGFAALGGMTTAAMSIAFNTQDTPSAVETSDAPAPK